MDAAALNNHLVDKSYIGGYVPTQQDIAEFNALAAAPCGKQYPHAARWYAHIASFNMAVRASLPGAAAPAKPAKAAKKEDDFDDFFDDDDEEDDAPKETPAEMAARKKKEAEEKKKKNAPVGKSTIVFDVKPACLDGDDDDEDSG